MSQPTDGPLHPHAGERLWRAVRDEVWQAVVVDEQVLRLLAVAVLAHGHALLEDVPGVGKTLLARAFSRALGLGFARVQGTPDLLPGDVLGASVLEGTAFRFIPGPVFTNILLVDEINRATPRTQSALLEAMEEGQVSIEGETRALPDPFLVLATENPIELEGTFALPEAQLDRFLVRIRLGYPSREDEARIARRYRASAEPLDAVARVIPPGELLAMRESVRSVEVSAPVEAYLVDLVRETRERPEVRLGGSPRSSMALYRATQAWAYLAGRDFALPDDVKALVPAVLGHRIILDIDRQLRGSTPEDVIEAVLASVDAPPVEAGETPAVRGARAVAVLLVLAGALLGSPGLLLVGVLMGLVAALRSMWSRYGLRALGYERHVSAERVPWGERIDLDLVVRNAKPLPLPWLRVDDLVTHGADIVGHKLTPSEERGYDVLRATWSIGWFERVTRRLQITGSRRGSYRFVSAGLRVTGLFGESGATEERPLTTAWRVVPRTVAVRSTLADSPTVGASRAMRGLVEDPSLFAGVRPYQPGDPLRRIHWKATARVGRPVSRRYDPAREREVLLAVDMQTVVGASWLLNWDDELAEGMCVAALSLARAFIVDGIAVGLAVNAFSNRPQRTVFLAPSAAPAQVAAIADHLAEVSPFASEPFERLLAGVTRRVPAGCTVVGLSARDPSGFLPVLRRLGIQGYRASHAALGPDAIEWSARARAIGVPSVAYRLDPGWQTADALERVA